jgi:hypothetical protein
MNAEIEIIDFKGGCWKVMFFEKAQRYLHKGCVYWRVWVQAPERPNELKTYEEIPLPIFTEWWPE